MNRNQDTYRLFGEYTLAWINETNGNSLGNLQSLVDVVVSMCTVVKWRGLPGASRVTFSCLTLPRTTCTVFRGDPASELGLRPALASRGCVRFYHTPSLTVKHINPPSQRRPVQPVLSPCPLPPHPMWAMSISCISIWTKRSNVHPRPGSRGGHRPSSVLASTRLLALGGLRLASALRGGVARSRDTARVVLDGRRRALRLL